MKQRLSESQSILHRKSKNSLDKESGLRFVRALDSLLTKTAVKCTWYLDRYYIMEFKCSQSACNMVCNYEKDSSEVSSCSM